MRFVLALLATTALASMAHAEVAPVPALDIHDPIPGKLDPRMRTFPFNPAVPLRATATGGTPVRLVLEQGETPVSFAGPLVSQDSKTATDWFATSFANTLVLQPLKKDIPVSFMFVTTAINGEPRNYSVELHTREGNIADVKDPLAYVQVQYTYQPTPELAAAKAQAALKASNAQLISTRLTQARYSAPRNRHYEMHGNGCAKFAPEKQLKRNWLSDDGHQTAALFYGHQATPTFMTTDDQGEPQLIAPTPISHRAGTLYILPSTYDTFEMRRGVLVCEVRNDRYDPTGTTLGGGTGTISPDVLLRVRSPVKPAP